MASSTKQITKNGAAPNYMGSVVEEQSIQGDIEINVRFRVDEVSLTHSSRL